MWFLYALLGAIGKSYSGFFRKKMAGSVSAAMYLWVSNTLILLVLTPFLYARLPTTWEMLLTYPLVVLGTALSAMVATQLNLEALKREQLSYTAPLNAFVPVFTLFIAGWFLNETPPRFGVLGIAAIVVGAYVVNIKPGKLKWYKPLQRLFGSLGAQLSLAVALSYAINTVLTKVLSNQGYDPFSIMYAITLFSWILLLYVPLTKRAELVTTLRSDRRVLLGGAVSSFAGSLFHILAVANTYASYAASVRRLDAVISIALGYRYLKETDIRNKLIGSLIMTAGAVLMAVA